MFSLSHVIRLFIMTSIAMMGAFFCAFTVIDVIMQAHWPLLPASAEVIFRRIYIWMIISALTTAIFGVITFIFFYSRGLNKYQEFLRRVESLNFGGRIRSDMLRFPAQDEFGNLGAQLNIFISKLAFFDQSKTELALSEKEKFFTVAERAHFPILIFNTTVNDPQISYYNQPFKEYFLKKDAFIDHEGKTQTRYYNIHEIHLSDFHLRTDEEPNFFDNPQCSWIRNPEQNENMQTLRNMVFFNINGDKQYLFKEVLFVPIKNRAENITVQVMYVFLDPKIEEKSSSKNASSKNTNQ